MSYFQVKITNANHKYNGELAFVEFIAPKVYRIRLSSERHPQDRVIYNGRGLVCGAYDKYDSFCILKKSVKTVSGKTHTIKPFDSVPETFKFMNTVIGLDKSEVERKYPR